jgi:hypothetical protein
MWLALVAAEPSPVWIDRAREISMLREQGETLASIGRHFGPSAVRVRRILLCEGQDFADSMGSESAPDDNVESALGDSTT